MTKQKLLEKIESIVGDDASEEMEMKALFCGRVTKKDYKEAVEKLMLIYCIVHGHNKKHSCYHVHADWRKL